jgi:hypothetical protein
MRASLVLAFAASACFGAGPVPEGPTAAEVVFATPSDNGDPCGSSTYIDAVAIFGTTGYAIVEPYVPLNCNSAMPLPRPVAVAQFDTAGTNPHGTMAAGGALGMSMNGTFTPRLALGANGALWVSSNGNGTITAGPSQTQLMTGLPGAVNAVGVATDNTNLYVAVQSFTGGPGNGCIDEPVVPTFPAECNFIDNAGNPGLFQIPLASLTPNGSATPSQIVDPALVSFAYAELPNVMTANSGGIFFMTQTDGMSASLFQLASGASQPTLLDLFPSGASMPTPTSFVPVGIDADDTQVVVVMAQAMQPGAQSVPPGCLVFSRALPNGPTKTLLHTSAITCYGGSIDNGHVYFAIVSAEPVDCGGNCTAPIHGDGLGRLATTGAPDFTSIATGFSGFGAGPRRVFVDYMGPSVYAVDPNAIGRITKTAFDGRHDFPVEPSALVP